MAIIRWILGRIILLLDFVFRPKPLVRDAATQAGVDEHCKNLVLYQFRACPFCVKVRRQIRRLGLQIELRDAQAPGPHREELFKGGGELQVPCLRIAEPTGIRWMYESSDINAYLEGRFGLGAANSPR